MNGRPARRGESKSLISSTNKSQKPSNECFGPKGLVEAVDIDGGYVATTDSRSVLRKIADKLDLGIIDGADIKRIRESPNVLYPAG